MGKLISAFENDLRCPKCSGNLRIDRENNNIICQDDSSHLFPITEGIPHFVKRDEISAEDAKWVFEYDESAETYDSAIEFYNQALGTNLKDEYLELATQLPIGKENQAILDVSVGTGNMNLAIQGVYPNVPVNIAGVDLSIGFLRVAQEKFRTAGIQSLLLHSQVHTIPFKDETFDIITHSGGINTFSDIPGTLKEWVRLLKPDGTLLFVDEGISPAVRKTARGEAIITWNKLFEAKPPLDHLPSNVKNIKLWWIARGTFYVITCQKGEV